MRIRLGSAVLAGLLAGLGPGLGGAQAQVWSPGGRWLAYSLAETSPRAWPGWIFGADEPLENRREAPVAYRIWATEARTGASVLLSESAGPMTRPGWKRDGSALAYGRVSTGEDGRKRLELVVQDAPERSRVVMSWSLGDMADPSGLLKADVAWSPESRFVAVPRLGPEGLVVVGLDNGTVAYDLPGASRASWSPDGARLAYFREGKTPVLEVLDVRSGEITKVCEAPDSARFPAPAWRADGESVIFVSWGRDAARPRPGHEDDGPTLELEVRDLTNGQPGPATRLFRLPAGSKRALKGLALGFDVETAQVFYSVALEGQDVGIQWLYRKRQEARKLFNPFETSRPVTALAVCPLPGSSLLALRFGPEDRPTPLALCDAESEELRPIAPDDETRAEWLLAILSAMDQVLKTSEAEFGAAEPMPTRLPMPGDIDPSHPAFFRLLQLARQGRPLCDRPSGAPTPDPELSALLDEARLVFTYLLGEYPQALEAVEAREQRTTDRDERLRLMGLRAQIFLGMGQTDRAGAVVDWLRKQTGSASVRVEETALGYSLVTLPDAAEAWPEMLAERLNARKNGSGEGGEAGIFDDPILDPVNPDAPRPGLGLDPVPVQAPLPAIPGAARIQQPPVVQIRPELDLIRRLEADRIRRIREDAAAERRRRHP